MVVLSSREVGCGRGGQGRSRLVHWDSLAMGVLGQRGRPENQGGENSTATDCGGGTSPLLHTMSGIRGNIATPESRKVVGDEGGGNMVPVSSFDILVAFVFVSAPYNNDNNNCYIMNIMKSIGRIL